MDKEEFEIVVRDIFYFIGVFVINTRRLVEKNPVGFDKSGIGVNNFYSLCHQGYSVGQEKIIKNITVLEKLKFELKINIKQKDIQVYKRKKAHIEYQLSVLRKLADVMAWAILSEHIYKARRLYLHEKKIPLQKDVKSILKIVKDINSNPLSFALVSDITSFIQIGDLLVSTIDSENQTRNVEVIEVKTGEMNDKILQLLDTLETQKCEYLVYDFYKKHGEKGYKQMRRILNQEKRIAQYYEIIEKNQGVDPYSKCKTQIVEEKAPLDTYIEEFIKAVKISKEKGYSYTIIDKCLFMGVYKKDYIKREDALFKIACSADTNQFEYWEKHHKLKYPTIDLRSQFYNPITRSIFTISDDIEMIMDVVFGRTLVYLYLDIDNFMSLLKSFGIACRWSTTKEYEKKVKDIGKENIIEYENKCIMTGKYDSVLTTGLVGRIFSEWLKPISIVKLIKRLDIEENKLKISKTEENCSL